MTPARVTQREALQALHSPSMPPPTRVRLRIWGFTPAEVARAEQAARQTPRAAFWAFADVIPSIGGACPIPSADTIALDQGADYGWAWAVYLVGSHAG